MEKNDEKELMLRQVIELLDKAILIGDSQKASEYIMESAKILGKYNEKTEEELQRIDKLLERDSL